mmetsp:Transcript_32288/g.102696  ORF Transcript_32288/g.102696 Transcript_32288/m.102696 type:complete len:235 (+) Transcript_32288:578-1282(+)
MVMVLWCETLGIFSLRVPSSYLASVIAASTWAGRRMLRLTFCWRDHLRVPERSRRWCFTPSASAAGMSSFSSTGSSPDSFVSAEMVRTLLLMSTLISSLAKPGTSAATRTSLSVSERSTLMAWSMRPAVGICMSSPMGRKKESSKGARALPQGSRAARRSKKGVMANMLAGLGRVRVRAAAGVLGALLLLLLLLLLFLVLLSLLLLRVCGAMVCAPRQHLPAGVVRVCACVCCV